MGATSLGFRYPDPGDAPDVPLRMGYLAEDLDAYLLDLIAPPAAYTPDLTALSSPPTLGTTGKLEKGEWKRQPGGLIHYRFFLKVGTGSSTGAGQYFVSLPVTADAGFVGGSVEASGACVIRDSSATTTYNGTVVINSSSPTVVSLYVDNAPVTATVPFTWAAGDFLAGSITYREA